jgi:hypothetical protein
VRGSPTVPRINNDPALICQARQQFYNGKVSPTYSEACLTCQLFVTTAEFLPQHRKQLDHTRALIARAEADGHTRLAEMNRTVETNLLTIITTLEADQHDCRCTSADSETCCGKASSDAP